MRPQRTVLLIIASVLALLGVGLLAAGGSLVGIHVTQRDGDGYYSSDRHRFETPTNALTSERVDLDLDVGDGDWALLDDLGTARLEVRRHDGADVFVGIGPADAVDRYLDGVAHDEVVDVVGRGGPAVYARQRGELTPSAPSTQSFWVASSAGPGEQRLLWEVEAGEWTAVVMNADGSPGIDVDASVGLETNVLLLIGIGLLFGAVVVGGAGGATAVVALRRREPGGPAATPVPVAAGSYPVRVRGELDPSLNRGLWLVKWFLAIPHVVVLALLWPVALVLTVVAGFVILFTGRYPATIFDFNVGVMRWTWRVTFYAVTLGTDRYPPFQLAADPDYPADLEIDRPASLSRGLVLVKSWLLALPHYVVIAVFGGGFTWWAWGAGADGRAIGGAGLVGILAFIAGVFLLVTRRYPQSIFDFVVGMQRWTYRVIAYAALMRDEYPPFRLDVGGSDPGSLPPDTGTSGETDRPIAA